MADPYCRGQGRDFRANNGALGESAVPASRRHESTKGAVFTGKLCTQTTNSVAMGSSAEAKTWLTQIWLKNPRVLG